MSGFVAAVAPRSVTFETSTVPRTINEKKELALTLAQANWVGKQIANEAKRREPAMDGFV